MQQSIQVHKALVPGLDMGNGAVKDELPDAVGVTAVPGSIFRSSAAA
ncbi:MAG: hypothetical protein ACLSB9_38690 [Hydrogeniiclostridium mannosilyticum]